MSAGQGAPWTPTAPTQPGSISPFKPSHCGHLTTAFTDKALELIFLDSDLSSPTCCVHWGLLPNLSALQVAHLRTGGAIPMPQGCCENEVC